MGRLLGAEISGCRLFQMSMLSGVIHCWKQVDVAAVYTDFGVALRCRWYCYCYCGAQSYCVSATAYREYVEFLGGKLTRVRGKTLRIRQLQFCDLFIRCW